MNIFGKKPISISVKRGYNHNKSQIAIWRLDGRLQQSKDSACLVKIMQGPPAIILWRILQLNDLQSIFLDKIVTVFETDILL